MASTDYLLIQSWQLELLACLKVNSDAGHNLPTPLQPDIRRKVVLEVGKMMFRCSRDLMRHILQSSLQITGLPGYSLTLLYFALTVLVASSQVDEGGPGVLEIADDISSFKQVLSSAHRSGELYVRSIVSTKRDAGWKGIVHTPNTQSEIITARPQDMDLSWLQSTDNLPLLAETQEAWSTASIDEWLSLHVPTMELLPWTSNNGQANAFYSTTSSSW